MRVIISFQHDVPPVLHRIGIWATRMEYSLSTPVPRTFKGVKNGDTVSLKKYINIKILNMPFCYRTEHR